MNSFKCFTNIDCQYYPCHEVDGELNCMFCYCPLYFLDCPGNYTMIDGKIKDCSACIFPHQGEKSWDLVQEELQKATSG